MTISKDEAERFRQISIEKYELDRQSELVTARREGLAQGIAQGERKGMRKVAKNMKQFGNSPENISAVTGLTPEEIARL